MSTPRQPALDGVRALALVLVLFFHAGFAWMPAGYMGVSVFFTLSGYLITNLLLDEFDTAGRIELGAFYSRRWRRLLPAGLLCLLGIVMLRFAGAFAEVQHLRTDLSAATLQVFNWTELSGGSSYADLYAQSAQELSPVKHYWSLAIEEQFYLLWPVVLLWLARRSQRRGGSVLWSVAALTAVFVVAAPLIGWAFGPDAAYWATPARFGEILVGATLACALRARPLPQSWSRTSSWSPGATLVAGCCLAVVVVSSVALPSDDGPAFHGWLGPFAIVSAGLIVGLQAPGPFRRALSWRPLVWVGLVSYGAYLFHWPVFVLLSARGWALSEPPSFAVAVTLTFALAAGSYRLVEHPIRVRSWSTVRVAGAAAIATAVTIVAAVVTPAATGGFLVADQGLLDAAAIAPAEAIAPLVRPTVPSTSTTPTSSTTPARSTTPTSSTPTSTIVAVAPPVVELAPPPNRPVRILVVGDSTAFYIGHGLASWAVDHPRHAQVDLLWGQGFGVLTNGTITAWDATEYVERSTEILDDELPERIALLQPDVVVMMVTIDDVLDRVWDEQEGELSAEDPRWQERVRQAYRDATASILDQDVASVVWIVPPMPVGFQNAEELGDPNTFEVHHEIIRTVADEFAPAASAVELHRWMVAGGHDVDESWRPDGTHLTEDSAARIAEMMLGASIVSVVGA